MEVNANARLTYLYVRRLDRGKYLALAVFAFLTMMGIFGFFFHVAQATDPDLVSNIMYPLSSGVGASWAFITAYRAYRGPLRLGLQHALAWFLVGMGLLANCLGGFYYTYLER